MSRLRTSLRRGAAVALPCLMFLIAFPGEGRAACKRADIRGTYEFFAYFGGEAPGDRTEVGTLACRLVVGKAGRVGYGSVCTKRSSLSGSEIFTVTGGEFAVNKACRVIGNFTDEERCEFVYTRAQMAENAATISGVGTDCDGLISMFTAVKS